MHCLPLLRAIRSSLSLAGGRAVPAVALAVGMAACQSSPPADNASDGSTGSEPPGSTGSEPPGSTGADTEGSDTTVDPDTGVDSTGTPTCDSPVTCAQEAEDAAAAELEAVRNDPGALFDFLVAMPLGGDLHHHLSGGVYAEAYMAWAQEDGDFCITQGSLSLSTSCGDGNDVPLPSGRRELYLDIVRAWSMFEFVPTPQESGADHFFATFAKFGAMSGTRHGRMLAYIRRRAAQENVQYIEPMLTSNSTARSLGQSLWSGMGGGQMFVEDYAPLHAAFLAAPGFAQARARLVDDADDNEFIANAELECDSPKPQLGCDVVTRYQAYISRSGTDSGMFGEMIAAYEAAMVEPRIVALNLVGPEDGSAAMANYDRLMAMLGYLNGYYEGLSPLRLSLHAGEITPASIPPGYELDETQHIRKAVEIAGARRIGHGIDVLDENDPGQLFEQLREQDILVEICLASNDIILEVAGAGHPIHDYIDQGVPIALATDDQGVARSTLAAEFVRAVADQGLDYYQLKTMVRASLQYSFLQGDSLWADYRGAMVAAECAPADGDTPVTQPPSGACETFLQDNARAEVQRELEARFEAFESTF